MRIEQFEYIEAWQLVQELIRKVNEKKIEQEKMKKQKYDLEKRLLEYSARIIKKIHSQNAHLP
ncbi:MAG: hypothetical protein KAU41_12185 [Deltaproteobacteria bacterium]|nr:hypothetical protein [Deltaproteobacteria bacterium]